MISRQILLATWAFRMDLTGLQGVWDVALSLCYIGRETETVKVKVVFAFVNVFTIHAVIVECHEMQEQMNLWRSKQMSSYR